MQAVVPGVVAQPRRARLVDQRRGFQEPGEYTVSGVHPAGHHLIEKHRQRFHMQVDGTGDQDGAMPGRTVPADLPGGLRHHPVQQRVTEHLGDQRAQLVGPRTGVAAQEGAQ